jgi:hypothetical protein
MRPERSAAASSGRGSRARRCVMTDTSGPMGQEIDALMTQPSAVATT